MNTWPHTVDCSGTQMAMVDRRNLPDGHTHTNAHTPFFVRSARQQQKLKIKKNGQRCAGQMVVGPTSSSMSIKYNNHGVYETGFGSCKHCAHTHTQTRSYQKPRVRRRAGGNRFAVCLCAWLSHVEQRPLTKRAA